MKKLLFTLFTLSALVAFSQVPQGISYQGIARNSSGTILANLPIGIKLDLHQGSVGGTVVFSETHTPTTNQFGLFGLGIGSVNTSGFATINWGGGPYFLEVSIDPAGGTSYTPLAGTQQFMSVPYALYAQTSGNASPTPTITINAPNSVSGSAGSYSINVPAQTLSINSNSISISNGNTITLPTPAVYTASTGINVSGNTITNTAPDQTVTITPAGSASVTGTYPNFTINTPTTQVYTAGNGIDITTAGVISNTATAIPPTIVGTGATTVTSSGNTFTVNTPAPQVYTAGNGIDISALGVISNTLTPITPTLSVSGNSISINPGNTQALPNYSLTQSGANIDLTQNGASIATVTLTAATSTSLSAGSSNIILNQSGNAYTITPVTPTFTNSGSGLTTINGSYPNYTVNSTASPSTTLVQGNNVTLNQSGSTYTVNATSYSLSSNSNTLTLTNGTVVSTATVPAQSAYVGTANNITVISNTINLATTGVTASNYGANATNGVPTFSVDNFGRLTTASQYTPNVLGDVIGSINTSTVSKLRGVNISTLAPTASQVLQFNAGSWTPSTIAPTTITGTGTGIATVTTALNNFTVNVPPPTYNTATGILGFGTTTINATPTLSLTGSTLSSGTSSVNLATLPGLWTAPTGTTVALTTTSNLVGIGTTTPAHKLDVVYSNTATAAIHGINSGAGVASTGVFGEHASNGIGVYGQSASGQGVWGKSTSNAGVYGESVSGDAGKFLMTGTGPSFGVQVQTNGTGAALYAKTNSTVTTALAAKFDGHSWLSGKVRIDSTLTMAAYPSVPAKSVNNEGRIYYDLSLQKFMVSENTGVYKPLFGASPWIQGSGVVTQGTNNDKVGIGTLSPNSLLDILNSASSSVLTTPILNIVNTNPAYTNGGTGIITVDNQATGGGAAGLFIKMASGGDGIMSTITNTTSNATNIYAEHKGVGYVGNFFINNPTSNAQTFLVSTNGLGQGINAQITNTASTSDLINATNYGRGNAGFFQNINASNPAKALEANTNGTGAAVGGANSGSGAAAIFAVTNATNTSAAVQVSTNGTGTALQSYNTNPSNFSAVIQASQISTGVALYASNTNTTSGSVAQFDGYSPSYAVNAINNGSGGALYAVSNANQAIFASSTSSTSPAVYITNTNLADGMQVNSNSSRAILAQSGSNGTAAVEVNNTGNGTGITSYKNVGATGGNAASFQNNSSTNPADAVFAFNNGVGASVHAANNSANAASNLSLWLENGHIKATGSTVTVGTTSVVGGFSALGTPTVLANSNDIKGAFSFSTGVTGFSTTNYAEIEIRFAKNYSTIPVVTLSPLTDMQGLNYLVTNVTVTSFFVRVYRSTNSTVPVTISGTPLFKFNYMVIE